MNLRDCLRTRLLLVFTALALLVAPLSALAVQPEAAPTVVQKNIQQPLASAARTSSGQSAWFDVGEADQIIGYLTVTATTGGTLDVVFQETPDGSTAFDIPGMTFTQVSSGSSSQTVYATRSFAKKVRVKYTISGGFTFHVEFFAYNGNPIVVASADANAANLTTGTLPNARLSAVPASALAEDVARTTSVNLSAANLIAMGTTPVSLISAPGSGKVILVESIVFKMTRTSTAYTGGGALEFRYTNASGAKVSADIAATVVTTGGAGTEYNSVAGVVTSLTPVANAAIVITNATAPFADGTGTAVVTIKYRVVTP